MDDIDGTGHYERVSDAPPPSLLAIVLDTNPFAWSSLASTLPLSHAVADLLVFINAHLAFNHANRVAVIASHCGRTAWLYPSPSSRNITVNSGEYAANNAEPWVAPSNPNKYRPFSLIEHELLQNLQALFSSTEPADLVASPTSTMLSGALTLALSYVHKTMISLSSSASAQPASSNTDTLNLATAGNPGGAQQQSSKLTSRILVVSASGDLAGQYIPIMNLIFAAQHSRIPIDILKLAGDTVLLQQASYTTSGIFLSPSALPGSATLQSLDSDKSAASSDSTKPDQRRKHKSATPVSILPTLLFAFLPDSTARQHLVPPTGINVDFRAACFCHRRVVDIGFVCSICLSIFCEEGVELGIRGSRGTSSAAEVGGESRGAHSVAAIKDTGECLTCGTTLSLRALNGSGAVGDILLSEQPKARKKKKKRREEVASNAE